MITETRFSRVQTGDMKAAVVRGWFLGGCVWSESNYSLLWQQQPLKTVDTLYSHSSGLCVVNIREPQSTVCNLLKLGFILQTLFPSSLHLLSFKSLSIRFGVENVSLGQHFFLY